MGKRKLLLVISVVLLVACLRGGIVGIINLCQIVNPQMVSSLDEARFWDGKVMEVEYYYAHEGGFGRQVFSYPFVENFYSIRLTEGGYVWIALPGMLTNFYEGVDVYKNVEGIREYGEKDAKRILVKVHRIYGESRKILRERIGRDYTPHTEDNTEYSYYVECITKQECYGSIVGTFFVLGIFYLFFWWCLCKYREEKVALELAEKEIRRNEQREINLMLDKEKKWAKYDKDEV